MDDAGFPVKAEEFVVLSQEPSVSEAITYKVARPFIEVRLILVQQGPHCGLTCSSLPLPILQLAIPRTLSCGEAQR